MDCLSNLISTHEAPRNRSIVSEVSLKLRYQLFIEKVKRLTLAFRMSESGNKVWLVVGKLGFLKTYEKT